MSGRVAIVGYAQTKYDGNKDATREEAVFEVVEKTLDMTGLTREDIGTVIGATNDYYDGRTISNAYLVEPSGAYLKDESKVEEDGAFAALYGYMRILSEVHDTAMVYGVSMGSQFKPHLVSTYELDPTFDLQTGLLNDISTAALQARSYMTKYGVTDEQIAKVSVKNMRNACKNSYALRQMPDITVEEVLDSKMLYSPIRELNVYPITDGACAVMLASEERAKEITDEPVWIKGVGSCQDTYFRDRELFKSYPLQVAAKKAYEMAGIASPVGEIDVAEVYESFSHQELIWSEALGFCREGKGGTLMDGGATEVMGEIPINPSGGALSANPLCATGLVRMTEAAMQIRGEAGKHQIPDVKVALAHGATGVCAQSNIVFILGGE